MTELIKDIELKYQTPEAWFEKVMKNFPLLVADHASNERKAAATCLDFVVRYPDRTSLVKMAIRFAEEEISHFRMVVDRMIKEEMPLLPDEKDSYVRGLLKQVRQPSEERLMDRLLISSIIEARGLERFEILGEKHPNEEWREFYRDLTKSEKGHALGFYKEATKLFPVDEVNQRLQELLACEAEICRTTPNSGRFH